MRSLEPCQKKASGFSLVGEAVGGAPTGVICEKASTCPSASQGMQQVLKLRENKHTISLLGLIWGGLFPAPSSAAGAAPDRKSWVYTSRQDKVPACP